MPINKPVTVAIDDLANTLRKDCEESGLPATIILPIIASIHRDLEMFSMDEIARDRQAYNELLKNEEEEK